MTEESLSEKIICLKHTYTKCKWAYPEEDVKEAVRRLKKEIKKFVEDHETDGESKEYCFYALENKFIKEVVDKIFGDKLI